MAQQLRQWAESRGFRAAWGPLTLLRAVRADLERRRTEGELDEAFARANLTFDFEQQHPGANGWRVVVIVMPRPAHLVGFVVGGRQIEAVMPPTYQRYRPIFEDVRKELAGVLGGAAVETLNAPLKLLAARLGVVRYGRNNLTYAQSIGSYLQILGYLTDADLPVEPGWEPREPALLDECADCGICEAVCPTGAIGPDRVLLRAQRCLTLANETAGGWPSWVPASAHHCLIGCLRCQRLCPANPELATVETGVVFSEQETTTLLAGGEPVGPAWTGIRAKLEALGQPYQEEVLGRNLQALLQAEQRGANGLE
jgi:epoxyqueuosine reductase